MGIYDLLAGVLVTLSLVGIFMEIRERRIDRVIYFVVILGFSIMSWQTVQVIREFSALVHEGTQNVKAVGEAAKEMATAQKEAMGRIRDSAISQMQGMLEKWKR